MEDGRIVFFTGEQSRKARNLAADPRLAISIVQHDNPYRMAALRARLVDIVRGDAAMAIVDRISHKYTGEPFAIRDMSVFVLDPEWSTSMDLPYEHTPPS